MTVSVARHSYSTTLGIDPTGGSSYVSIAEVIEINGPGIKVTATKRTNLNSPNGYQEKIPGLADQGQLTCKLNFSEAQYTSLVAVIRTPLIAFKITFPLTGTQTVAATLTGQGQIAELGMAFPDDDRITCDATFEASGKWTFTAGTPTV
jgi:hypothetical protein